MLAYLPHRAPHGYSIEVAVKDPGRRHPRLRRRDRLAHLGEALLHFMALAQEVEGFRTEEVVIEHTPAWV